MGSTSTQTRVPQTTGYLTLGLYTHHVVRVVTVHPATSTAHKRQRVDNVGQGTVLEGQGGVEAIDMKGSETALPHSRSFTNLVHRETSEAARPKVGVAVDY